MAKEILEQPLQAPMESHIDWRHSGLFFWIAIGEYLSGDVKAAVLLGTISEIIATRHSWQPRVRGALDKIKPHK